jgi:membrane associated rhomboid family serine protease
MNAPLPRSPVPMSRQPIFNLPRVVIWLVALLLAVHAVRLYVLSDATDVGMLLTFAFIPIRETAPAAVAAVMPTWIGPQLWTFVTYAFLHADWAHVAFNALWLAAFGSPLAWRFGTGRFLAFSAAGAIAGALLHLAVHWNDLVPMVGASAAISAHMAGASRFVFAAGGPMWGMGRGSAAYRLPAAPLSLIVRDRRVIAFLAVWFGLNLLFGLTGGQTGLASGAIAWEAHIGGFVAGLLLFPLFDPVQPQRR